MGLGESLAKFGEAIGNVRDRRTKERYHQESLAAQAERLRQYQANREEERQKPEILIEKLGYQLAMEKDPQKSHEIKAQLNTVLSAYEESTGAMKRIMARQSEDTDFVSEGPKITKIDPQILDGVPAAPGSGFFEDDDNDMVARWAGWEDEALPIISNNLSRSGYKNWHSGHARDIMSTARFRMEGGANINELRRDMLSVPIEHGSYGGKGKSIPRPMSAIKRGDEKTSVGAKKSKPTTITITEAQAGSGNRYSPDIEKKIMKFMTDNKLKSRAQAERELKKAGKLK